MDDKLFVIGVGGTGMRCLESFVHLCAIGMFDGKEIDILMLDTDANNGNLSRTKDLISSYNKIKSTTADDGGAPTKNTFFSAKLNSHLFHTDYYGQGRSNYVGLSGLNGGKLEDEENKMLSNLFLDEDTVQKFNLEHGYRAQTHLGSHLMYHGIVEAAIKLAKNEDISDPERELDDFLNKLREAQQNAKVFVFGSVFGGTGASSIPILPSALQKAIQIRAKGAEFNLQKVKFGSTLLTQYFQFKPASDQQKKKGDDNAVIAASEFFPINSQAALQFYQSDPTVQSIYNRFYHIGWPLNSKSVDNDSSTDVETGGSTQKNDCHLVDLFCACAALDFFQDDSIIENEKSQYVFRTAQLENGAFNFRALDLVGEKNDRDKLFVKKMGAFLSLAHMVLSTNEAAFAQGSSVGFGWFVQHLKQKFKVDTYDSLDVKDLTEMDNYMKKFAYEFLNGNVFSSGWIYQVRNSLIPGKFIFSNSAFSKSKDELKKIDVGALFEDKNYHWEASKGLFGGEPRYDERLQIFLGKLPKIELDTDAHQITNKKEELIALLHDGIMLSQDQQSV